MMKIEVSSVLNIHLLCLSVISAPVASKTPNLVLEADFSSKLLLVLLC